MHSLPLNIRLVRFYWGFSLIDERLLAKVGRHLLIHELNKFTATVKTFLRDCLFKSPHTPLANGIILALKELKKHWAT
jgi:hypothetical protein